jgi:capsular polysaccharide biosynthesis protein
MPAPAQRLFKHTAEHRRWKMRQLFERYAPPVDRSPTILFWVPGGMPLLLHVEGVIAAALRLRGFNVHAIICDAPYRACVTREITTGVPLEKWADACAKCISRTRGVLDILGIPFSSIGDFVPEEKRAELREIANRATLSNVGELRHNGILVGHNVLSTITRFLQGTRLEEGDEIVKEYAYSALVSAEAAAKALDRFNPMRVFMSHGVYVDWGPALHTAFERGIPVTGWKASYLTARFFFRHVEDSKRIDFHKLSERAWNERKRRALSPEEDASLQEFLDRRYHQRVSFDMKQLREYTGEVEHFRTKYNLDPKKPVWGVMAHINWDSVSDYSPMAYPSFDEWMIDTINHISRITDVQWLVKVHPIEADDNPAAGVQHLVQTHFPDLPPHVRVIPAEEGISPLEFFQLVDGGVTVYGTAGLELALQGKPVILAGEAHYGGKGYTYDGLDIESYRELLQRASTLGPLSDDQTQLARMYAYSYFVQRQIPLPPVRDPNSIWWNLQHHRRDQLLPGADPFVDFICERLISGQDFVMDRELVSLADSDKWA